MSRYKLLGSALAILFVASVSISTLWTASPANAADHREAPVINFEPALDINDTYAFLSPDGQRLVLASTLNPFSVPAVTSTYGFNRQALYQFKIDNSGDGVEDFVVQCVFSGGAGAFNQTVSCYGPTPPPTTGAINQLLSGSPTAQGPVNQIINGSNGVQVFAGLRDDPFVTDASQLVSNILGSSSAPITSDVTREFTSPALGFLRGRPIREDGRSGVDTFGGFNTSTIIVSFPKNLVRGPGFFGIPGLLGFWGTASRSIPNTANFVQVERFGQQLVATVFVPSAMRDTFNAAIPQNDMAAFSNLIPDALTTTDSDGTGNTIAGRAALLDAIGVTALPNGAPLLLPPSFNNTNPNLLRIALLPDVGRLDLDRAPEDFAIGAFGLQNGRIPQFDVTDVLLRLARQLADVKFPDGAGVPGSGPLGTRAALNCSDLATFPQCTDRRVLAVLQGTDFIEADDRVADVSNSGNDAEFPSVTGGTTALFTETVFPFFGAPNPIPGAPGTRNFALQTNDVFDVFISDGDGCSLAASGKGNMSGVALMLLAPVVYVFVRRLRKKS
ncbi:MAG: DUF4331 family protein [Deltaproteobacteria bacterium]